MPRLGNAGSKNIGGSTKVGTKTGLSPGTKTKRPGGGSK